MEYYCGNMIMLVGWLLLVVATACSTSVVAESSVGGFELPIYHTFHPKYTGDISNEFEAFINKPKKLSYMVEFQIGTPPVQVSAVLDTGTTLTWLSARSFDSSKSTSYQALSCDEARCSFEAKHYMTCKFEAKARKHWNDCYYYARYAEGRQSGGSAGLDVVRLKDETSLSLLIGVEGNDTKADLSGVFGLGYGTAGFVRGLGANNNFSICIPLNYPDSSFVRFGNKAQLEGKYTQLKVVNSRYTFRIKAISVAGRVIQIPTDEDADGFIFDTAAAVTHLHPEVMEAVRDAIENTVGKPGMSDKWRNYDICYPESVLESVGDYTRKLQLQLQFADADDWLPLSFTRTWSRALPIMSHLWCFAFVTAPTNRSIFGSWQMRGINFGLDPSAGRLYYQSGC